jgi:phosphatidylethanolamine/phosphatidyl-N-methylethanolamine N-methyltransferase
LIQEKTTTIYNTLSSFYDFIFFVLIPGHKKVGRFLKENEIKQVLEVGVGTGLTFGHYPEGTELIGVDMSAGMLEVAENRKKERPDMKIELRQGDALDLPFADNSYECCYAPSLLTVVPHPKQLLKEMIRVTKPGGYIVIISHFEGDRKRDAMFTKMADPLTRRLFGFRMDLKLRLLDQCSNVDVVVREKVNPVGPFALSHLLILKKHDQANQTA